MKKLALLILFIISIAGYSQSLDCSKFKHGKFYNTSFPSSYFAIKDTIMEDVDEDIVICTWSINWLNNCEFEAICTKSNTNIIAIGEKVIVTITDINDDCFAFNRKLLNKKFGNGSDTYAFYSCIKKD